MFPQAQIAPFPFPGCDQDLSLPAGARLHHELAGGGASGPLLPHSVAGQRGCSGAVLPSSTPQHVARQPNSSQLHSLHLTNIMSSLTSSRPGIKTLPTATVGVRPTATGLPGLAFSRSQSPPHFPAQQNLTDVALGSTG